LAKKLVLFEVFMPLTRLHVINVCKLGKKHQECRYLEEDDALQPGTYQCLKLSPHRKIIYEEVESYQRRHRQKKSDDVPIADNCKGYPVLRHKNVGYDQKNA